jgi:hypothetical protein
MTDKDDLYKNLEFALNAYTIAENVFPLWEAAFALIVGQILIVSAIWFILVSLNCLNAAYVDGEMCKIRDCIRTYHFSTPFIWPWPDNYLVKDEIQKANQQNGQF